MDGGGEFLHSVQELCPPQLKCLGIFKSVTRVSESV